MCLPEGSTGNGPGPLPDWEPRSCRCCCLWEGTRCVLPSPGFSGEVPGLGLQKQSWAAATAPTWTEEQVAGRGYPAFPVQGGRRWDLKQVMSREPQATPSATWLVPDVVGKWEIKRPQDGLFQPPFLPAGLFPAWLLPMSRRDRVQRAQDSPMLQPAPCIREATSV